MNGPGRFAELFAAIDAGDVEAFMEWLTDDCTFVYGSGEPVRGADAVRATVAGFLAGFTSVAHRVDASWEVDSTAVTEGAVTYTGADGREVTLPFCDVFHLAEDGRIGDYRIYIDPTPLG